VRCGTAFCQLAGRPFVGMSHAHAMAALH
jgi:hypothetical protein